MQHRSLSAVTIRLLCPGDQGPGYWRGLVCHGQNERAAFMERDLQRSTMIYHDLQAYNILLQSPRLGAHRHFLNHYYSAHFGKCHEGLSTEASCRTWIWGHRSRAGMWNYLGPSWALLVKYSLADVPF